MLRNCKDCGHAFTATPRRRQCSFCKVLKRLWNGFWGRLIYDDRYRTSDYEGIPSLTWFLNWGRQQLIDFNRVNPDGIPSVDRIDASRSYCQDNIRIVDKRQNSGRRRTNAFKTKEQVEKARRLKRGGATYEQIAWECDCSIHAAWFLFNRRKYFP